MHSFRLQEWTTIRGGVASVTQGEHEWLDLEEFQDVFFWLQLSGSSGTVSLTYQTSPTPDDSLFTAMAAAVSLATPSSTPIVTPVLMLSSTIPLARFVRWQLNGTAPWDATFRIMVAACAPTR